VTSLKVLQAGDKAGFLASQGGCAHEVTRSVGRQAGGGIPSCQRGQGPPGGPDVQGEHRREQKPRAGARSAVSPAEAGLKYRCAFVLCSSRGSPSAALGIPGERPAQRRAGTAAPSAVVTLTASAEQTLCGRVCLFAVKHSAPSPFQAKASQGSSPASRDPHISSQDLHISGPRLSPSFLEDLDNHHEKLGLVRWKRKFRLFCALN